MNELAGRLSALRAQLGRQGLQGFVVPRADAHLGEYIPSSENRLRWLTGFTGSAGAAVVLADRAAFFTDGRYQLQAGAQVDARNFELRHLIEAPPEAWVKEVLKPGQKLGYDPWLHGQEGRDRLASACKSVGAELIAVSANPIDAVWADRPAAPATPVVPHALSRAGVDSATKRGELASQLAEAQEDAVVLTAPESLAWLLNIRAGDVRFTPLPRGFAIVTRDGSVDLFVDPARFDAAARTHLGNGVSVRLPATFGSALAGLGGKRVRVDPAGSPVAVADLLREGGAVVSPGPDPVALPRARKNPVELEGSRAAHRRDGVALVRFLAWLDAEAPSGRLTEQAAAERLVAFRAEGEWFQGESFPAIVGSGPNGAIIHYRVTEASDRRIEPGDVFLVDSGAQYLDGTTDVTRTVLVGGTAPALSDVDLAEIRTRATAVLRGHIALATLVWPEGVAGPHIEAFARRALWDLGLDYDHGTGHGVGSYLSVHEGPASLSRAAKPVPLAPGMILSDEPGFYAPGRYGIRLENLVVVERRQMAGSVKPMLGFETLTLAPFDRRLIDPGALSPGERGWIDAYHARVLRELGPLVGQDRAWLEAACATLG